MQRSAALETCKPRFFSQNKTAFSYSLRDAAAAGTLMVMALNGMRLKQRVGGVGLGCRLGWWLWFRFFLFGVKPAGAFIPSLNTGVVVVLAQDFEGLENGLHEADRPTFRCSPSLGVLFSAWV